MKRLFLTTLAALAATAGAQSATDIVSRVDAAQKSAKDISFKLSGNATLNGQAQKLDLDIQTIPAQNVVRVNFNAPDSVADNVLVLDNKTVYNYLYLTNQVTVQNVQSAASSAGLSANFSQITDLTGSLKSRYDVRLLGSSSEGGAKVYQLEATPKAGGDRARLWVSDQGWRPVRFQTLGAGGQVATDLTISNYKVNSGLSATKLKALPRDAQVIKR